MSTVINNMSTIKQKIPYISVLLAVFVIGVVGLIIIMFSLVTNNKDASQTVVTPTPLEVGAGLNLLNPIPTQRPVAAIGDVALATAEVTMFTNTFLETLATKNWAQVKLMLDLPDFTVDVNDISLSSLLYEVNRYSVDGTYSASIYSDTISFDGSFARASVSHGGFTEKSTIALVKRDSGWKIYTFE